MLKIGYLWIVVIQELTVSMMLIYKSFPGMLLVHMYACLWYSNSMITHIDLNFSSYFALKFWPEKRQIGRKSYMFYCSFWCFFVV